MRFHSFFQRQKIRDSSFRMAFCNGHTTDHLLFSRYASGAEYRQVCNHIYEQNIRNPEMDEQILDFETEGRWFCLLNWHNGTIRSKLAFEHKSDYAMFRLMGFAE